MKHFMIMAASAGFLLGAGETAAAPVTLDVNLNATFSELFGTPSRDLTVTGQVTVDDLNTDGVIGDTFAGSFITIDEVLSWSFAISDSSDAGFDFAIASTDAGASDTNSAFTGNTTTIGGLAFQNLGFTGALGQLQIDLFNNELRVQNNAVSAIAGPPPIAALYESTGVTVANTITPPEDLSAVPLPAGLPLLLAALGGLAVAGRRNRA